ncbi:MAG: spore germination protein [Clostridia bacterium]|nr:spore germination protein [Clostridia bacterium]
MNILTDSLQKNLTEIKGLLPSEDILTYAFQLADGTDCAVIYADGIVNKQLIGDLIARPLSKLDFSKNTENGHTMSATKSNSEQESKTAILLKATLFPELKTKTQIQDVIKEILDGNSLLLIDGEKTGFIVGAKLLPNRAIMEPPTDVTVKGPREGFIEDIKTNMSLVRKRLKSPDLRFETLRVGKRSDTAVTLCWLNGVAKTELKTEIKEKIQSIDVDVIPDSSYIAAFLSPRKHSIFHTLGTTEKPDVFTAKLSEGRVGVLVDGSPIALTAPYLLSEDLQSGEDYYISPFAATSFRFLRALALFVAILLPAFYVSAQLFKMQLLPLGLMLTIASSVQSLPLSPSLEMFVVLFLLETLKEASIRMPKYVGMSLSVVGALVLGETAVSAGFLSTPAIIIVALSGICMYTVPNFVETGSLLRWLFLLVAGSIGPFGIVLLLAFTLYYLFSSDAFGTPMLAPFSPLISRDLRDSVVKYDLFSLKKRPRVLGSKNKTRLREPHEKMQNGDTMSATKSKNNQNGGENS